MKDGRMNVVVMYFRVYFFVPNRESHVREIQVALLDESQLQQNCTMHPKTQRWCNFCSLQSSLARMTLFH